MNIAFNRRNYVDQGEGQEFYSEENFAEIFEKSYKLDDKKENTVVNGIITAINKDVVIVDIGLKDEGRIPIKEFVQGGKVQELNVGDKIDVYIQSYENRHGRLILSREKALKEIGWKHLEDAMKEKNTINGIIVGRIKGGLMVDLNGVIAFLPGSQIDTKPVKDISPLIGVEQPFMVLKIDREQGNIIVSRRAVLEEARKEAKYELLAQIKVGQVLDGVVKNITDYGAFIDLGNNIDGLLHVTDISWSKITHPSEVLALGQKMQVKVIKYDEDTKRISLGMKQLEDNPWQGLDKKYPVGTKMKGKVTNIIDYGAFIELEPKIEGLVHVSELSWTKPNVHPSKLLKVEQEVEFVILDIDVDKHRISLGMKQCMESVWKTIEAKYPVGTVIEGKVVEVLKMGLVVNFTEDVNGIVYAADISWTDPPKKALQKYKVGDDVKAMILAIDPDKNRINLGIKHLELDPFEESFKNIKRGDTLTCKVTGVSNNGITVDANGVESFIVKTDLSSDKVERRPDRFSVGDRLDAKVVKLDKIGRSIGLSIRALEEAERKQKISEYGSVSSGASLGDILGKAISVAEEDKGSTKQSKDKKKGEK